MTEKKVRIQQRSFHEVSCVLLLPLWERTSMAGDISPCPCPRDQSSFGGRKDRDWSCSENWDKRVLTCLQDQLWAESCRGSCYVTLLNFQSDKARNGICQSKCFITPLQHIMLEVPVFGTKLSTEMKIFCPPPFPLLPWPWWGVGGGTDLHLLCKRLLICIYSFLGFLLNIYG